MAFDLNNPHEANRRHWNEQADLWEERSDREGRWSRCREDPGLAFEGGALQLIQEVSGGVCNNFHWTLADLLNPMAAAGLTLVRLLESPARDTRYWRDSSGGEAGGHVLEWTANPLAGLPVWLAAARKTG